jgi:hypothetical protein
METTIPAAEDAGFDVDIGYDEDDYGQVEISEQLVAMVAYELGLQRYLHGSGSTGGFAA